MDSQELAQYIIVGDAKKAEEWTQKALADGMGPLDIMNKGLIAGMEVVGDKFRNGIYYLPEVLLSARAMKSTLKLIRPLLADRKDVPTRGRVVVGTVKGDVHDIGKNIVAMMLEGAGFEVYDLGIDVPAEAFLKAVEEHKPQVLGMSAMLTTTMTYMKTVLESLQAAELRGMVKVVIGGAPVTEEYSRLVKADGYASDAIAAVETVKQLLADNG